MALNCYADVLSFKRRYMSLPDATALDAVDASEIEKVLETASRSVDGYCGKPESPRHFYSELATKYVALEYQRYRLWLPDDLISITTLKTDEDEDRTFEKTWAAGTDYYLGPENGGFNGASLPKLYIDVDRENTLVDFFPKGRRSAEVIGKWGYIDDTELLSRTATVADATTTTITLSGSDASIETGQTLLLEEEQIYVQDYNGTVTVTGTRGVNGTTGVAHAGGTAIRRFVYHPLVRDATLITAGRIWERRKNAYATVINIPSVGTIDTVQQGVDADVQVMLAPLRKTMVTI